MRSSRMLICVLTTGGAVAAWAAWSASLLSIKQAVAAPEKTEAEPAPPDGQTYIGIKRCASCHFDQYTIWKATKHSKTFDLLPAKYQTDATCLKCHTTGYGEATGFKTAADADLKGTSCEACHGPGSKHADIAKAFANQKATPEQEKLARDSIWKIQPKNACVQCHVMQGHHPNPTPKELQTKK